MTSRDFCFWLQGYFEIGGITHDTLTPEQVTCIQKHLSLVFKHEIDPSMGPPEHQAKLNAVHEPAKPAPVIDPTSWIRPEFNGGALRC